MISRTIKSMVAAIAVLAMLGIGPSVAHVEGAYDAHVDRAGTESQDFIYWNVYSEDRSNYCLATECFGYCCYKIPNPS